MELRLLDRRVATRTSTDLRFLWAYDIHIDHPRLDTFFLSLFVSHDPRSSSTFPSRPPDLAPERPPPISYTFTRRPSRWEPNESPFIERHSKKYIRIQQTKSRIAKGVDMISVSSKPRKEKYYTSRRKETPIFELQHDFECQIFAWRAWVLFIFGVSSSLFPLFDCCLVSSFSHSLLFGEEWQIELQIPTHRIWFGCPTKRLWASWICPCLIHIFSSLCSLFWHLTILARS